MARRWPKASCGGRDRGGSVGLASGEGFDRVDVDAGEHPLGYPPGKPGAGEDTELTRRVGDSPAIGSEPTAAGKSAGGGEIGVGGFGAQPSYRLGGDRILDPFDCEPGADPGYGLAAPMQGLNAGRGISRIVEQPRMAVALDQRVDQHRRLL